MGLKLAATRIDQRLVGNDGRLFERDCDPTPSIFIFDDAHRDVTHLLGMYVTRDTAEGEDDRHFHVLRAVSQLADEKDPSAGNVDCGCDFTRTFLSDVQRVDLNGSGNGLVTSASALVTPVAATVPWAAVAMPAAVMGVVAAIVTTMITAITAAVSAVELCPFPLDLPEKRGVLRLGQICWMQPLALSLAIRWVLRRVAIAELRSAWYAPAFRSELLDMKALDRSCESR